MLINMDSNIKEYEKMASYYTNSLDKLSADLKEVQKEYTINFSKVIQLLRIKKRLFYLVIMAEKEFILAVQKLNNETTYEKHRLSRIH